jgi:hypothetical protein
VLLVLGMMSIGVLIKEMTVRFKMGCYLMCSAQSCGLQTIAACAFGLFKIKKGP